MARKWLRRIAFGILVLLILYLAAYLWVDAVAGSRLEAELSRIRERGEPLTLEEMAPPPIPDEENAAVPLAEAAALLKMAGSEELEAEERLLESPFELDPESADRVSAWIERNGLALEKLEEALGRPGCRFEVDYSDALAMEFPHLWQVMEAGKLLAARSLLHARDGRIEEALEDCLGGLHFAKLAGSDPILILFLVRISAESKVLDCLEHILARHEVPAAIRGRLLAALEEIELRRSFRRTLLGERCFGISAFTKVQEDVEAVEQAVTGGTDSGSGWRLTPEPVLRLDLAYYLSMMSRAIELADGAYSETRADWASLHDEATDAPWYAILSPAIMVMLPNLVETTAKHRVRLDFATIALGGEASGPDPFTGKPYETGGEVLRSPGPDADDESDDIVWRVGSGRDGN